MKPRSVSASHPGAVSATSFVLTAAPSLRRRPAVSHPASCGAPVGRAVGTVPVVIRSPRLLVPLVLSAVLTAACTSGDGGPPPASPSPRVTTEHDTAASSPSPPASPDATPTATGSPTAGGAALEPAATPAPAWLGTRELPRRADGYGEIQPTPPDLDPRHIATRDLLPPPNGLTFRSSVRPVPDDVLARSTWHEDCPVPRDELRYVQVSFWGFDARPHTGELLVAAGVAEDMVTVFEQLYEARFPIEEMRVVDASELELPPTGDGNNTTGFVCRPVRGRTSWSQHALGLAVDVNPFHNPYVKDDVVLPELASTYTHREDVRPGMVVAGDVVTTAFADIGWGWGGDWTSPYDPMHFSSDGT
ncbi:MAG: M15 family metallopeptidase [Actinobacteria bacterium]|nr:M15 family metallopeptidase [Actinomycetota bacterium]